MAAPLLFDDTECLPLFCGLPIMVVLKEPKVPAVPVGQMRLGGIACRTCLDTGVVVVGNRKKICWCQIQRSKL